MVEARVGIKGRKDVGKLRFFEILIRLAHNLICGGCEIQMGQENDMCLGLGLWACR